MLFIKTSIYKATFRNFSSKQTMFKHNDCINQDIQLSSLDECHKIQNWFS